MSRRTTAVAAVAVTAAVLLGGCTAKDREQYRDAGRTGVVNNERVDLGSNADGFSNYSTKCDHGNRVYTAYHGDGSYAAIAVVPHDLSCPQPAAR